MKKKGKLGRIIIIVVVVIILAAIFGGKGKQNGPVPTNTNTANSMTQNDVTPTGKIDEHTTNTIPVPPENTTSTEPDKTKDKDYISPELKEFLQSYEAFMDEYCEFMEHYDSANATQLLEYASLMQKYSDFAKKADEYDESTMTDAETIYYVETLNRINVKLMKASQNMK